MPLSCHSDRAGRLRRIEGDLKDVRLVRRVHA